MRVARVLLIPFDNLTHSYLMARKTYRSRLLANCIFNCFVNHQQCDMRRICSKDMMTSMINVSIFRI